MQPPGQLQARPGSDDVSRPRARQQNKKKKKKRKKKGKAAIASSRLHRSSRTPLLDAGQVSASCRVSPRTLRRLVRRVHAFTNHKLAVPSERTCWQALVARIPHLLLCGTGPIRLGVDRNEVHGALIPTVPHCFHALAGGCRHVPPGVVRAEVPQ